MIRPLWRTLWDALKFLIIFVVVLFMLNHFGVVDILPGQVSVIDGDSLRQGQTEIRLFGIDAPEYRQSCRDQYNKEYPCGKRAAEALRKLTMQGELKCQSSEKDRYGRSVSICHIGQMDVNREMVKQGWAVAYVDFGPDYIGAEKLARQSKSGIWAGTFEVPSQYRQRVRNLSGDIAALQDLPPD